MVPPSPCGEDTHVGSVARVRSDGCVRTCAVGWLGLTDARGRAARGSVGVCARVAGAPGVPAALGVGAGDTHGLRRRMGKRAAGVTEMYRERGGGDPGPCRLCKDNGQRTPPEDRGGGWSRVGLACKPDSAPIPEAISFQVQTPGRVSPAPGHPRVHPKGPSDQGFLSSSPPSPPFRRGTYGPTQSTQIQRVNCQGGMPLPKRWT